MVKVTKQSKWSFDTSNGGSASTPTLISISVSAGGLFLKSPYGMPWRLSYKAAGVGAGVGKTMVGGSIKDMYSVGKILILDNFDGDELTIDDMTGVCTIQDVSLVAGRGISATVMFLGLEDSDPLLEAVKDGFSLSLVGMAINDFFDTWDIDLPKAIESSAKAMLVMGGEMAGMVGAGITSSIGYVTAHGGMMAGIKQALQQSKGR